MNPALPSICRALLLIGLAAHVTAAPAAALIVTVADDAGLALSDAVVYAEPAAGAGSGAPRTVEIEQKDRKFIPLVSVVQAGTSISFPNHDRVRHHVYSFSPAKQFELKLYAGLPGTPLVFDKPGSVVLGCNIHDQMVAYIQVVPTPYFGKTDAKGQLRLEGLPPGKYTLKAWHYNQAGNVAAEQPAQLAGDASAAFRLKLRPAGGSAAARTASY